MLFPVLLPPSPPGAPFPPGELLPFPPGPPFPPFPPGAFPPPPPLPPFPPFPFLAKRIPLSRNDDVEL
ncbi:hypothetical protein DOA20_22570 [Salmonella enterica subsp. enterica serovar Newport]|nr:hypothetical protein [Salmonella enterica subsp. enterica serovar Newport]